MKPVAGLLRFAMLCTTLFTIIFAQNSSAQETHGIVVTSIDRSVKPGDDFYHYANGQCLKHTEIPPDRISMDVWNKLGDLSNKRALADLPSAVDHHDAGVRQRLGGQPFRMSREQASLTGHEATLPQVKQGL